MESALRVDSARPASDTAPAPFVVRMPVRQGGPLVYASPHSGRHYPDRFISISALDQLALRASEDAFVDDLFTAAPDLGSPLLSATYARAYLDVNREAYELDPHMFADPLPDYVNIRSGRVTAGLGTIAKVVASGTYIYRDKLTFAEAEERIAAIYRPYHRIQQSLMDRTFDQFGCAVLVDCHSMPSMGTGYGEVPFKHKGKMPDFILGDRYGRSCSPVITDTVQQFLQGRGYNVVRNDPYSGGFNTRHYSDLMRGRHALQIEISRALYMNEKTVQPSSDFTRLKQDLSDMMATLQALPHSLLQAA